jgi:hypothetical protein
VTQRQKTKARGTNLIFFSTTSVVAQMSCPINGNCARRPVQTDITKENYLLTGVAILIIITFLVINCTVKATTAVVLTLCTAVSLFMVWLCMTAVAGQSSTLRPIGSTSGLPAMANTMDMRTLVGVGTTPAPKHVCNGSKLTAQNCLVGAYNPEFIDLDETTWNYNKVPVEGAVPGAGDPNGEESARWMAASEAWRQKIAAGIRPDDNIVFDVDEGLPVEQRISKPVEIYDFSTTAHGGYGQRMIQEGIPTQHIPAHLTRSFGQDRRGPSGVLKVDQHQLRTHGPEGIFIEGFDP